jgi:hypothetical protein
MAISKYTHLRPILKLYIQHTCTFLHVFIRVISIFRQAIGTSFMKSSIKIICFFSQYLQNFKVNFLFALRSSFDILQRSISQNCKKIILNSGINTGIYGYHSFKEKFEDTKRVTRSRKSKDRQYNDQKKSDSLTTNPVIQCRKKN